MLTTKNNTKRRLRNYLKTKCVYVCVCLGRMRAKWRTIERNKLFIALDVSHSGLANFTLTKIYYKLYIDNIKSIGVNRCESFHYYSNVIL